MNFRFRLILLVILAIFISIAVNGTENIAGEIYLVKNIASLDILKDTILAKYSLKTPLKLVLVQENKGYSLKPIKFKVKSVSEKNLIVYGNIKGRTLFHSFLARLTHESKKNEKYFSSFIIFIKQLSFYFKLYYYKPKLAFNAEVSLKESVSLKNFIFFRPRKKLKAYKINLIPADLYGLSLVRVGYIDIEKLVAILKNINSPLIKKINKVREIFLKLTFSPLFKSFLKNFSGDIILGFSTSVFTNNFWKNSCLIIPIRNLAPVKKTFKRLMSNLILYKILPRLSSYKNISYFTIQTKRHSIFTAVVGKNLVISFTKTLLYRVIDTYNGEIKPFNLKLKNDLIFYFKEKDNYLIFTKKGNKINMNLEIESNGVKYK